MTYSEFLSFKLLQNFQVSTVSITQYLDNVKVIVLHFRAINMTELINLKGTNFVMFICTYQTTSLTASCIFMSIQVRRTWAIERLHYSACAPHMRVVFSMIETTHLYDIHVRRTCVIL